MKVEGHWVFFLTCMYLRRNWGKDGSDAQKNEIGFMQATLCGAVMNRNKFGAGVFQIDMTASSPQS